MYGAQTPWTVAYVLFLFENDVEMYGAQTIGAISSKCSRFENDVEMYGAQTNKHSISLLLSLRMM